MAAEFLRRGRSWLLLQIGRLALPDSMAVRVGIVAFVFCGSLAFGLFWLVSSRAHDAQFDQLARASKNARQTLDARFRALDDDVRDAVRRVVDVTTEVLEPPPPAPQGEGEGGEALPPALPLAERWRTRLVASLRELLETRSDTLDVTYLGRFGGDPNGGLMVARIERDPRGNPRSSEVDPRPGWDGEYLQRVIQSEGDDVLVSQPTFPEGPGATRYAQVRAATPVRGSDGSVVGVVLISVKLGDVLAALRESLPGDADALLVTAQGASLMHPTPELALAHGDGADEVIDAAFPDLAAADESRDERADFGTVEGQRAEYLSRFDVGGPPPRGLSLRLVVAEPVADVDLATSAAWAALFGSPVVRLLSLLLVAAAAMALVRWRRRPAVAADEASESHSALAERAEAIEAEERVAADAEPQELPDLDALPSAAAEEAGEAGCEADDGERLAGDEAAAEPAPAAAADPPAEPAACDAEAVPPAPPVAFPPPPQRSPAPDPRSQPRITALGMRSARELAGARSRLVEELEEARRRSLDELAAARERFEAELALERERAIERLVRESSEAFASELGEPLPAAHAPRRPGVETCEFDLRRLLSEVAAWMDGETLGREERFGVRCSRAVPDRMLGDPEWVGPLLVNLARSALRCSEDEPVELSVSCSDDGPGGVVLCFELSAKETGLTTDAEGRLREAGFSGLSLTEELVDAMRGELRVERASGAGSRVRVTLPMSLPR